MGSVSILGDAGRRAADTTSVIPQSHGSKWGLVFWSHGLNDSPRPTGNSRGDPSLCQDVLATLLDPSFLSSRTGSQSLGSSPGLGLRMGTCLLSVSGLLSGSPGSCASPSNICHSAPTLASTTASLEGCLQASRPVGRVLTSHPACLLEDGWQKGLWQGRMGWEQPRDGLMGAGPGPPCAGHC